MTLRSTRHERPLPRPADIERGDREERLGREEGRRDHRIRGTVPGGVALDSQSYSYIVDAMEGYETAPAGVLAPQQLALVRLYLYTPGTLWLTPTVEREYERISDP